MYSSLYSCVGWGVSIIVDISKITHESHNIEYVVVLKASPTSRLQYSLKKRESFRVYIWKCKGVWEMLHLKRN